MKLRGVDYINYVIKICSLALVTKLPHVFTKISKKNITLPSTEKHFFINISLKVYSALIDVSTS